MVKNLREKYPDKVPLVIKRDKSTKTIKDVGTLKYLVQDNITVAQVIFILRKKIEIESTDSFFMYVYKDKKPLLKFSRYCYII